MTFVHGKNTAVALGGYDISQYLNEADAVVSIDTAETSHFGSQPKTYLAGLDDGTYSLKGLFDGALGGIDDISKVVVGWSNNDTIVPVIVGNGGPTAGSLCRMGRAKVTGWEVDAPVSDVVSISGDLQATGGVKSGIVLMWDSAATASVNGTDIVGAGSDQLTVVACIDNQTDDEVQVTVQHSDDGTTWTDLVVLDSVAATTTAGLVGTALSTKAHVRAKTTFNGTGTASIVVAASRY